MNILLVSLMGLLLNYYPHRLKHINTIICTLFCLVALDFLSFNTKFLSDQNNIILVEIGFHISAFFQIIRFQGPDARKLRIVLGPIYGILLSHLMLKSGNNYAIASYVIYWIGVFFRPDKDEPGDYLRNKKVHGIFMMLSYLLITVFYLQSGLLTIVPRIFQSLSTLMKEQKRQTLMKKINNLIIIVIRSQENFKANSL